LSDGRATGLRGACPARARCAPDVVAFRAAGRVLLRPTRTDGGGAFAGRVAGRDPVRQLRSRPAAGGRGPAQAPRARVLLPSRPRIRPLVGAVGPVHDANTAS